MNIFKFIPPQFKLYTFSYIKKIHQRNAIYNSECIGKVEDRYKEKCKDCKKTIGYFMEGRDHLLRTEVTGISQAKIFAILPFKDKYDALYWFRVEIPEQMTSASCGEIGIFENFRPGEIGFIIFYPKSSDRLHIENIEVHGKNRRGLGSELLRILELFAVQFGYNEITGWLSSADYGFRREQVSFYQKNNYTVKLNGESGSIIKRLTIGGESN